MKGLLQIGTLRANATRIRLVKTSGEATRRLVVDNYVGLEASF